MFLTLIIRYVGLWIVILVSGCTNLYVLCFHWGLILLVVGY